MASDFDSVRNRKQRSEERIGQIMSEYAALAPKSNTSTGGTSDFANIRNRKSNSIAIPSSSPLANIPKSEIGEGFLIPSTLQQVTNINKLSPGFKNNLIPDIPKKLPPTFQQQVENINSSPLLPERKNIYERITSFLPEPNKNSIAANLNLKPGQSPVSAATKGAIDVPNIPFVTDTTPTANFLRGAANATTGGIVKDQDALLAEPRGGFNTFAGQAGNVAGIVGSGLLLPELRVAGGLAKAGTMGNKVLSGAANFGLLTGLSEGVQELRNPNEQTLAQHALDVGIGTGLGAVTGGALGLPAVMKKYAQDAVDKLLSPRLNAASAIEKVNSSVPVSGRLKVEGNTDKLSRVMGQIKPIVTERMTPPAENPRLLAKWLQPHLNASLSQINRLSYDDMLQLASEVQRSLSVEEVAKAVAKERGVDLGALLDQTAPTFKQVAERMRMGGVAGAIDAPANVRTAVGGSVMGRVDKDLVDDVIQAPDKPMTDKLSPETYQQSWFEKLFGNQGLGASAGGGPAKSVSDTIVRKGIKETPKQGLQHVSEAAKAAHRMFVNKFEDLKAVGNNVFEAAEDSTRANQIANQIMGKEFVTPEGEVIGEGFQKLMSYVPRGKDRTLFDYLILKDAQARVPRGERVYHESIKVPDPNNPSQAIELNSVEGLQSRVNQLESQNPWLKDMSNRWNTFTKNLRQVYGINEGLISQELNDTLEAARPDYIRMQRQFTRGEKPKGKTFGSSSESFSGKKGPIQKVNKKGSARNIIDPRKTMSESVGQWVNNAMRNRAMQELVKNIKANPDDFKGIAEIEPKTLTNQQTGGVFKNKVQNRENVVTAMVGGEPVDIRIHMPEVVTALKGMNPTELGLTLSIAKMGSNLVKNSATGTLAPAFAAKSGVVDLPTALIQAEGNRGRFLLDYVHAIGSGFANKLGDNKFAQLARDYERAGGGFSAALRGERALNKSLGKLRRDPILHPRNIAKAAVSPLTIPYKFSHTIADVFENAPRIAATQGKLRKLGGQRTPENVRKAMQAGREITVPYNRKGTQSDEIEAMVPYTGAAIQGSARLARQIKTKPLQTLAGVTALVGLPKAYEYMQFSDDADYQRLPAREKFRNLIISKNEDGTFNKIPLEPSYAGFGAAALDFYRYIKENDPDSFKGMSDSLSNAYLPPVVSGALQGLTQGGEGTKSAIEKSLGGLVNSTSFGAPLGVWANQSFTGAPIDSAAVADRSPENRYDERTSKIAKWLGEKMSFSPMKIDYLLRQYGGDLARIGLPANSDVGGGNPLKALTRNFLVDPVMTNNLANDYYTGKDLLSAAKKDNAEVEAELPKWYNETLAKELSTTARGSITAKLKDLTAKKKEISANKSLSAKEKSDLTRSVQRQINDIYIEANAKMQAAGVPFPRR